MVGTFVQPAGRRRGRAGEGGLPGEAGGVVELEAERGDEGGVVARRDVVRGHAAAGEEREVVDGRAVDGPVPAARPLELGDLEAAALGALGDRLGLQDAGVECRGPVPNGAPLMGNVLLVEPVTPAQAPVARLYQPAPVFGGACVRSPSSAAEVPFLRNAPIVGRTPADVLPTRSWRSPSEAKKTAPPPLPALGTLGLAALAATGPRPATSTADMTRTETRGTRERGNYHDGTSWHIKPRRSRRCHERRGQCRSPSMPGPTGSSADSALTLGTARAPVRRSVGRRRRRCSGSQSMSRASHHPRRSSSVRSPAGDRFEVEPGRLDEPLVVGRLGYGLGEPYQALVVGSRRPLVFAGS